MIALPIISIVACIAYVVFILFRYGVPVSISETYYLLPNKWDWMFSAWCLMTSLPLGMYWFSVSPSGLRWMSVVCMIAMNFIGVACRYKSGPKSEDDIVKGDIVVGGVVGERKGFRGLLKELREKFSMKEMFRYGWTKPIHYVNSLIVIIVTTVFICMVNPAAILSTVFFYVVFILIGLKVDGVYNRNYSADVDNKSWIFFMEVICFLQLFVYLLAI